MTTLLNYSLNRTVAPSVDPVTLAEAKDQCELHADGTAHDTKLAIYIDAAWEQVEHDTGYALTSQTFTQSFASFTDVQEVNDTGTFIRLKRRPVQSISSITYYDSDNSQQTLATTVYGLDAAARKVYLKYDQDWPNITEQYNGIVITFVAGYGDATTVPAIFKQMVLLKVAEQFYDRGDMDRLNQWATSYEALYRKIRDPHYP